MRFDEMYLVPKLEYEHLLRSESKGGGIGGEKENAIPAAPSAEGRPNVDDGFASATDGIPSQASQADAFATSAPEIPSTSTSGGGKRKERLGAVQIVPSKDKGAAAEHRVTAFAEELGKRMAKKKKKSSMGGGSPYSLW